jgi:hypothetical protein|tara:strand:+ start:4490 stop:5074 length:585 start_codon:yes stop_codon:yes gene_type:complete
MKTKISKRTLNLLTRKLRENEEMKQRAATKSQEPFRLRRKKETQVKEEEEVGVEKQVTTKEPVKTEKMAPVPTYDTIKDKLNMVRSGKSLDDDAIGPQLQAYFGDLSDAEKTGMLAYLTALAEIVSGGEAAQKVDEPSDSPYKVKMTLTRTGSESDDAKSPKTPRAQIAQDAPIIVGESAKGKAFLKRLLERNR